MKRHIKPKKLKEIGSQVMSLQASGGIAGSRCDFILNDYIKIHSLLNTGAFCYLYLSELTTARNTNSIFSDIINNGSTGTVNSGGSNWSLNTAAYLYFRVPLIVKSITMVQASASAANIVFFCENYSV